MQHRGDRGPGSVLTDQVVPRVSVIGAKADGSSCARALHVEAAGPLPAALIAELRTDQAGESGAVMIYRGILAVTRDASLRHFAQAHLTTEVGHLARIEPLLAPQHRSRLLPLWRMAGWLIGALPAMVGPRVVYATIEAVETFVDQHYAEQIESIDRHDPGSDHPPLQALRDLLQTCRCDEIAHRDEAAALFVLSGKPPLLAMRLWIWSVGAGSRVAVKICRRV